MAEYQNLFTRVQAVGPGPAWRRPAAGQQPAHRAAPAWYLLGLLGNAQVGPSTWAAWAWRR
jgi:hypothetical protein